MASNEMSLQALVGWRRADRHQQAARRWKAAAKRWWRLYQKQCDIPWLLWLATNTGRLDDIEKAAEVIASSIHEDTLKRKDASTTVRLKILAAQLRTIADALECKAVQSTIDQVRQRWNLEGGT